MCLRYPFGQDRFRAILAAVRAGREFQTVDGWSVERIAALATTGCDPVVNIAGANFPAWMLCAIVGAIAAAALNPLLAVIGIEPHSGPRILIYSMPRLLDWMRGLPLFFNRI